MAGAGARRLPGDSPSREWSIADRRFELYSGRPPLVAGDVKRASAVARESPARVTARRLKIMRLRVGSRGFAVPGDASRFN